MLNTYNKYHDLSIIDVAFFHLQNISDEKILIKSFPLPTTLRRVKEGKVPS